MNIKHLNEDKYWFVTAIIIIFFSFLLKQPIQTSIFIIPLVLLMVFYKLKTSEILIILSLALTLVFVGYINTENILNELLNKRIANIHLHITEWISDKYSNDLSSLINWIIFNHNKKDNSLFNTFKTLGVAHILTISGFHMFLFSYIINWLLGRFNINKNKNQLIKVFFIFIYWWTINFSLPGGRVFFTMLFPNSKPISKWSKSVLLTSFIFFAKIPTLSFLLSFFIPLIFIFIDKTDLSVSNKLITKSISAFLFSSCLLLPFQGKIYFLSFFNSIFLIPIFSVIFIYFLFNWWNVLFTPIHNYIYWCLLNLTPQLKINLINIRISNISTLEIGYLFAFIITIYLLRIIKF